MGGTTTQWYRCIPLPDVCLTTSLFTVEKSLEYAQEAELRLRREKGDAYVDALDEGERHLAVAFAAAPAFIERLNAAEDERRAFILALDSSHK